MSTIFGPWRNPDESNNGIINNGTISTTITTITTSQQQQQQQQQQQKESEETSQLSQLFDFYIEEIVSQIKYFHSYADRKKLRDALEKKTCDKRCNRIDFSYQDSVIFRHAKEPAAHEFAKRLIELDYRYCKDCHRLIPKSSTRVTKMRTYSETPTPLCPCCNSRMANVAVLIRKTKMKEALFKFEGY